MPVTTSGHKALRRDRRRTIINLKTRNAYKEAVKLMRQKPSKEAYQKASSLLDQAAKKKVIHPNKAARLKSRLSKALTQAKSAESKEPKTKKPAKKTKKSSHGK